MYLRVSSLYAGHSKIEWNSFIKMLQRKHKRFPKVCLVSFVQRPGSIARRCEDALNLDKAKQNFFTVTNSRFGLKPKIVICWYYIARLES